MTYGERRGLEFFLRMARRCVRRGQKAQAAFYLERRRELLARVDASSARRLSRTSFLDAA